MAHREPLLTKAEAKRKAVAGVAGVVGGATIGAASVFLHTQRFGKQAASAAALMAVVFGVGAALRTK
ncbi:hypothetical protein JKP88DRAFT_221405 [Tribonema minus]|uniref:Uncharacterized protein n=1 Tax=Tribonema minus TaxID=303371 RepID=A0A836CDC9_9STRA|nr:hypothetical protein JKP88DRAFT_221405 [Tribonema minus]